MSRLKALAGLARSKWGESAAPFDSPSGPIQRAANEGTIIAVVVIGIVALIGTLIFCQVYEAIPQTALEDDGGEMNQFGEAVESLVDGLGGAMELVPIVLLVLIAALVIGVVQRMRTNGGGM